MLGLVWRGVGPLLAHVEQSQRRKLFRAMVCSVPRTGFFPPGDIPINKSRQSGGLGRVGRMGNRFGFDDVANRSLDHADDSGIMAYRRVRPGQLAGAGHLAVEAEASCGMPRRPSCPDQCRQRRERPKTAPPTGRRRASPDASGNSTVPSGSACWIREGGWRNEWAPPPPVRTGT